MTSKNKKRLFTIAFVLAFLTSPLFAGWDPDNEEVFVSGDYPEKIVAAIKAFKQNDPSMGRFFKNAYGFVIFPSIGKGGFGIGGAAGKGKVYEQGDYIGNSKLKQFTIGFQLGGQKYREIIFFQYKAALDNFTSGKFKFGAQASAVAATAGASADADYSDNVAVFTLTIRGLMYEATIGGQKFKFIPQ
jgi:lipid-binding SYLF domain-containing protein